MKAPTPTKAEASAPGTGAPIVAPTRFLGTENVRHLRVVDALLRRPMPREQVDQVAGCSNAPDLIAELRRRGLEVPCTRTKKKDRDLFDTWPGVYHFTQRDRIRIARWLAGRARGVAQ